LNGPTTKLTDMCLSLTFEQEILGEAAADKYDRSKPSLGTMTTKTMTTTMTTTMTGMAGGLPDPPVGLNLGHNWYAASNGTWITNTSDKKDNGPFTFTDPLGDVSGECRVVGKAKERELMTGFF
jgi:hypothetical protein